MPGRITYLDDPVFGLVACGFHRMPPPGLVFAAEPAPGWELRREGSHLVLCDGVGDVWACSDVNPDPRWVSAAASRRHVIVFFGPQLGAEDARRAGGQRHAPDRPAGRAVGCFGAGDSRLADARKMRGAVRCGSLDDMTAELRAELLRRAEQDQAARRDTEPNGESVASVDAGNLLWLKKVVAEIGWPGRSEVGEDGARAAWLLAQHADRDPVFQRECLDLMTEAAAKGEASTAHLAYLTDRVLLAEGQVQEYGTQVSVRTDGQVVAQRLRDPRHVDDRRAAASLGPLAEYIADIQRRQPSAG